MVLDTIIELENKIIKSKRRLPKVIKLNYFNYCLLIRETENTYFMNSIHGIPIKIIPTNKIVVE